jgi:hypothetical protein
MARRIGDTPLHLVTSDLPITLHDSSPIGVSESDTSSSADPSSAEPAASSVPGMGLFQYSREGPDTAWNEVNRQRRSSMHPAVRPVGMAREPSQNSHWSMQSSDSLASLWVEETTSARPVPRSTLSQTSLGTSPRPVLPAEFGSAPDHTFDLWHSFNNSFAKRDARVAATPTSPPITSARRPSYSLSRTSGTIRANKSHTNVTWDSFGQEELRAKQRRASASVKAVTPSGLLEAEHGTPKQSIEIGQKGCEIKYHATSPSHSTRPPNNRRASHRSVVSLRSDSSSEEDYAGALRIPRPQLGNAHGSSYSSSARTPTRMLPPCAPAVAVGSGTPGQTTMPDLAALRVGSRGCAPFVAGSTPSSAPKSNWNWSQFEREGGKTYEVPEGLKAHAGKTGLFYFQ